MVLTFVTACAPYHEALIERARATVEAQTVPCNQIVVYDWKCRGAGWARNEGLAHVSTPFVSFLDCDDLLGPTFAEECLSAYDGKHYVYTDWFTDTAVTAPACPWKGDGSWHVITTLLPTHWVKWVGGFDEQMRGGEDTEFYWKLTRSGLCGKRLAKPLFTYSADGQRGRQHVNDPNHNAIMNRAIAPYQELPMGCCQDNVTRDEMPPGQPQPGDQLAAILWHGPRQKVGKATGRLYTRVANARQMWVNPQDIDADPQSFARVVEMPPPLDPQELARFKSLAHDALDVKGVSTPSIMVPAGDQHAELVPHPDVRRVLELYRQNSRS